MERKTSVLIVDDDPGTCETLSDILEVRGLRVKTAKSGEECLEMLKNDDFDFILIDIKMQKMDGVETFRNIKKMKKKSKVIIMTAHAANDVTEEAYQEGAYSVVFKPLDLDKLIELVSG